ncbi:SCO family protein [Neobacillus cucumis]|uniref:SCO family protein n=1 Tax=Neobacillus cucumis TaxID=1740721 RepID=UPI0019660CBC|nr:SCO family protein [Neobacillus cucumis]MBM7655569.1 cytochrome oxidase Cu insertion factor (SCO1/SenC/PrrC family) [Neobacillus cucumis]
MLKKLRWFLYFVVAVLVVFNVWYYFHNKSTEAFDPNLKKFEKDLGISEVSPKNPPKFTLTDQNGKVVSLTDFKNKKMVIQPIDPRCTDVCPIISQELINANQQLGTSAKNVVYIGLNVNQYYNKVSDVKAFSDQEGLSHLKNWYFLTGSVDTLKKIWKDYGLIVEQPSKTQDVIHTSEMLFVNSNGKEMYDGNPQDDGATIKEWSNAISYIISKMP